MIERLTVEQEAKMAEYRDRYFRQATSTEPADRTRAEAAARRLAEIGGVKVRGVIWAQSPERGAGEYERAWASLRASLGASLRASLGASLRDSLGASLGASLRDSLRASLGASLGASLRDSLGASLWDSLLDSLGASLWDSLRASLRASLWASLRDSLGASLWDSGWLCMYAYAADVLGVQYDARSAELLHLYDEIARSCFAAWIVPGMVVLCERPAAVEVGDGKLIGLTWRE